MKRIGAALFLIGTAWLIISSGGHAALASEGLTALKVVPEKSRLDFVAGYSFLSHHLGIIGNLEGRFNAPSGNANMNLTDPGDRASADLIIDASSLSTGNEWRDRVLKKEYLEIERYPDIRFTLTRVGEFSRSSNSGNAADLVVKGSLTLHGVTREIVAKAKEVKKGRQVLVEGETTVRMTNFGMKLPELSPFLRGQDQVTVRFHVVLEPSTE